MQLRGGQICFFCNQQGSMTYFQIEILIRIRHIST